MQCTNTGPTPRSATAPLNVATSASASFGMRHIWGEPMNTCSASAPISTALLGPPLIPPATCAPMIAMLAPPPAWYPRYGVPGRAVTDLVYSDQRGRRRPPGVPPHVLLHHRQVRRVHRLRDRLPGGRHLGGQEGAVLHRSQDLHRLRRLRPRLPVRRHPRYVWRPGG